MSHVAIVDVEITNLDWLAQAAKSLGLEFCAGQQTYRWFGRYAGDSPLPEGFSAADLGHCDHAIKLRDQTWERGHTPHEIGIVRRRDGRPGWTMLYDFYTGKVFSGEHRGDYFGG